HKTPCTASVQHVILRAFDVCRDGPGGSGDRVVRGYGYSSGAFPMGDAMAVWMVILVGVFMLMAVVGGPVGAGVHIGWAQTDITPSGRVLLQGQFYARVAEK